MPRHIRLLATSASPTTAKPPPCFFLLGRVAMGLAVMVASATASCSHKLGQEECAHLMGHGVGLAAFSDTVVVPVDVNDLHQRAHGPSKQALDDFDRSCLGADEGDQILCARRAKTSDEFVACGPIAKRAREAGEVIQLALLKKHNADQCASYADHAVIIGAGTADDAGRLVQECDAWMEIGTYRCRLAAKDARAWAACE
ncbi:MAG: hypothetical protein NVS3B20_19760 [Polyangiales bacterium]